MQIATELTPGAPQMSRFQWICTVGKHTRPQIVTLGHVLEANLMQGQVII